ncbi:MAG: radical SAM family heme chaperone HemW [Chloroflexota bacterium]
MKISEQISIYLHIPFCSKRCGYCDFTTYAGKESLIPAYVDSLCNEIKFVTDLCNEKILAQTIFFGGGTPSLVTIEQYKKIFKTIENCFILMPNAEISLEVNPGSVNQDYLTDLCEVGFNRISLGAQSTNDEELRFLGRIHNREDIFNSVQAARMAGFKNLNLDLIFGLPGQKLENWKKSLNEVAALDIEHISLYALTIEKGTPFGVLAEKGSMSFPAPDLAAGMYEWAGDELEKHRFQQYEISNWAKRNFNCKHNLQYWKNLPYLGFGAGAHGYVNNMRISNVLRIKDYINRIEKLIVQIKGNASGRFPISPATVTSKSVSRYTSMQDTLMLGMRLTEEGVSTRVFRDRFGQELLVVFGKEISELLDLQLIEWIGESLRLTKRGRLLGNQVFMRFVD